MPLRICIISYLISKQATGLSTYVRTLITKLLDEGHQVTVLATNLEYAGAEASEAVDLDPRARRLTFAVRGTINRRLYRCPALVRWLRDHGKEFDILDIQGMWALVNFDAARTARRLGLPYILTPHGMLTRWDWNKRRPFKIWLYRLYGKGMIDHANTVRFLSKGELGNSAVPFQAPTIVIPNAVTPYAGHVPADVRSAVRSKLEVKPEAILVLFLGRVSYQKGLLELVKAIELVAQKRDDVHLLIIGPSDQDAWYAETVNTQVKNSPAKKQIHLLGPVFGEEKYMFLGAADIFATLSRNEGLSLAALEALAAGLPVILTSDANLPEVESEHAGRVVRCDPEDAATTLHYMFDEPGLLLTMSSNARHLYETRFSWTVVLPQLVSMYRAALLPSRK